MPVVFGRTARETPGGERRTRRRPLLLLLLPLRCRHTQRKDVRRRQRRALLLLLLLLFPPQSCAEGGKGKYYSAVRTCKKGKTCDRFLRTPENERKESDHRSEESPRGGFPLPLPPPPRIKDNKGGKELRGDIVLPPLGLSAGGESACWGE